MKTLALRLPPGKWTLKEKDGRYYAVKIKDKYPESLTDVYQLLESRDDYKAYSDKHSAKMKALGLLVKIRDSYRSIDNWRPNWNDNTPKYCVTTINGELAVTTETTCKRILAFKHYDACEALLNNFGDLLEACKELL